MQVNVSAHLYVCMHGNVCQYLHCMCKYTCISLQIQVVVTSITKHSFSLAVHGNYLYWTDWLLRAVLRANKYDGSGITWLRKDLERQPMGIVAVDQESSTCKSGLRFYH